jgi:hypothetical protein
MLYLSKGYSRKVQISKTIMEISPISLINPDRCGDQENRCGRSGMGSDRPQDQARPRAGRFDPDTGHFRLPLEKMRTRRPQAAQWRQGPSMTFARDILRLASAPHAICPCCGRDIPQDQPNDAELVAAVVEQRRR